jgi:hypothetical protein
MRLHWKLRLRPLTVGLAVAILRFAGPASDDLAAGTLSKDPCTLLRPAEIQAALAPNTDIGTGVPDNSALPLGIGCRYVWGPRTSEWGQTDLSVLVVDASKVWPAGLSSDDIKQRVLVEARSSGPDASEIPGIGDGAVFTTEPKSHNAKVKAYFVKAKGVFLEMKFHGGNALSQKDKLIALVKQAAARL